MTDSLYKHPRLYLNAPFEKNGVVALGRDHTHYLQNVLRKNIGDTIRVFNGVDGEWLGEVEGLGKKSGDLVLVEQVRTQPLSAVPFHLFFAPLQKKRMDMVIEKAVELGVSGLYPVITNRTEHRKINADRMRAQIIEAAEQCERLDLPILHAPEKLQDVLRLENLGVPLYACLERGGETKPISVFDFKGGGAFLIGPVGGFDDQEMAMIGVCADVVPISLGNTILRAETAAIVCLSYAQLSSAI